VDALVSALVGALIGSALGHVSHRGQARQDAAREIYGRVVASIEELDDASRAYMFSVDAICRAESDLPDKMRQRLEAEHQDVRRLGQRLDILLAELEVIGFEFTWLIARFVVYSYGPFAWPGSYIEDRDHARAAVAKWEAQKDGRSSRRRRLIKSMKADLQRDPLLHFCPEALPAAS
jgi:hypothetical protein